MCTKSFKWHFFCNRLLSSSTFSLSPMTSHTFSRLETSTPQVPAGPWLMATPRLSPWLCDWAGSELCWWPGRAQSWSQSRSRCHFNIITEKSTLHTHCSCCSAQTRIYLRWKDIKMMMVMSNKWITDINCGMFRCSDGGFQFQILRTRDQGCYVQMAATPLTPRASGSAGGNRRQW